MRPPEEREAAGEAEMIAAESALGRHRYREAQQHLAAAEQRGAPAQEIERLRGAVTAAVERQAQRGCLASWVGLGVGLAGYLLLSLRQPPDWSIPVWGVLAFLVVPVLIGGITGSWMGFEQAPARRFWAGGRAGSAAMALYTGFSLIAVRRRIGSGAGAGEVLLVGLFVTLAYAALAGAVAGLASALPGRRGQAERPA